MQNNITHDEGKHPIARHRRTHYENNLEYHRQAYFVTISTDQNHHFFGTHTNGQVRLSELGCLAHRSWHTMMDQWPNVERDKFIIMPNHVHAILWFTKASSGRHDQPLHRGHTQPQVVDVLENFRSSVTDFLCAEYGFLPFTVWNDESWYHEVHGEDALELTRRYILQNPQRWHMDHLNNDHEGLDPLFAQIRKVLGIRDTVPRELHRQTAE